MKYFRDPAFNRPTGGDAVIRREGGNEAYSVVEGR